MRLINKSKSQLWLWLSITVAILFALAGFKLAFESPYTIQDDARQHVFWMQQFNDKDLFNNDLIANYFSSVAPWGYKSLYWLANFCGIEPFLFNKFLPVIIGTITTVYLFFTVIEIFPVPFAGFVATLLLNQNLWMLDDLVSGTPRAFFYPLFLIFIYYLLRNRFVLCAIAIVLQGLFYPQIVLISVFVLIIGLVSNKTNRKFYICCLAIAFIVLSLYALKTSDFTQIIDIDTAKELPEFFVGGRNEFFVENPWAFWLNAPRSGFFPREWQYVLLCSFGLWLPIFKIYRNRFPLVSQMNSQIKIVGQILLASILMFALAHLFLFKLHLPSRYSQHTFRILIALIDGIAIAVLLNGITRKIVKYKHILKPLIATIIICGLLYPTYAVQSYPYRLGYVTGESTKLYEFLQQQPKDTLIASLSKEADFIPSLAKRSVLVAEEYSIPYHLDYYLPIRQRTKELIQAQYSLERETVNHFIRKYQVDFWLIDEEAFTLKYLENNSWLRSFEPETEKAISNLKSTSSLVLSSAINNCNLSLEESHILLKTNCLLERQ